MIIDSGLIKDEFALLNLQADVKWTGFESLIAITFLLGAILTFIAVKKHKLKYLYYGFGLNLLFIYLTINVIVPKIELYSQHAAIEFYEACSKHDCYIETHGFKSYAYLFYSKRTPKDYENKNQQRIIEEILTDWEKDGNSRLSSFPAANLYWMEHCPIDKPAFIVAKCTSDNELFLNKELTKLYSKNGFSFFVKMPNKTAK